MATYTVAKVIINTTHRQMLVQVGQRRKLQNRLEKLQRTPSLNKIHAAYLEHEIASCKAQLKTLEN